jgi:hypothetical protein
MTELGNIALASIASEDLYIDGSTSGVRLFIRRKRLGHIGQFGEGKTILMVHGASFSGESLFDVPFGGASFMNILRSKGLRRIFRGRSRLRQIVKARRDGTAAVGKRTTGVYRNRCG